MYMMWTQGQRFNSERQLFLADRPMNFEQIGVTLYDVRSQALIIHFGMWGKVNNALKSVDVIQENNETRPCDSPSSSDL